MLQPRGEPDLAPEALGADRAGGIGREHLHDHLPPERCIARNEDVRHSAAAELALDGVRLAQRSLQSFA